MSREGLCWRCCLALFSSHVRSISIAFAWRWCPCRLGCSGREDAGWRFDGLDLLWIPYALSMPHKLSRWILSKAFSKLTLLIYSCLCHSVHCSMLLCRVKIWSMHPRRFRKPGCFCLSRWSTASEIHLRMRLARILLRTDRRVTPLQLLQLPKAPFFGIFMMTPSVQSSSCCEGWLKNLMLQTLAMP